MPEDMSDRMPEDMPDRMPNRMPDHMPEDMPDRMPNRMPEDMSDRMPEDLPVRKCINVMVGITRSKVIYNYTFHVHDSGPIFTSTMTTKKKMTIPNFVHMNFLPNLHSVQVSVWETPFATF